MTERVAGLRQADEWMRLAEDRLDIGFWSLDASTGKFVCSSGLYALVGVNPASVQLDLAFLESLVHPADRMVVEDQRQFALDSRQASRRFRVIRPDGQLRHFLSEATSLFDREGQARRVVTIVSDVTERHAIDRRLSRKRALLFALAEILQGVVWVADVNGRLVERFGGIFAEFPDSDSEVEAWHNDLHPDDAARLPNHWRDMIGRRQPYAFSPRVRVAEGRYRQLHIRGVPFSPEYSSEPHYGGVSSASLGTLQAPGAAEDQENLALTPAQVRACRALLEWKAEDLAQHAGISVSTVRRIESAEATGNGESMRLVVLAFRDAGLCIREGADGRLAITDLSRSR